MITVYASIGNSDDKLSQSDWSNLCYRFVAEIRRFAHPIHGEWYSKTDSKWQNACVCFEIGNDDFAETSLKETLAEVAAAFGQDSIAWAVVAETEFIGPAESEGE